ncbi:uncharacterized protein LOC132316543 [Cornus florida]|uniref:uncharacterized protein LOC132316543 n=1 Tax=Cornus florida TaxID=4283 RepID=UPI002899C8CE|nr:uncharacterized protein LOC132316543 [Cornus florida]
MAEEALSRKTDEKGKFEGLPLESSPYTQYRDMEDYKLQGYGTQGHQQPQPGHGGGASTNAPTASAGRAASDAKLSPTDHPVNRQGVP